MPERTLGEVIDDSFTSPLLRFSRNDKLDPVIRWEATMLLRKLQDAAADVTKRRNQYIKTFGMLQSKAIVEQLKRLHEHSKNFPGLSGEAAAEEKAKLQNRLNHILLHPSEDLQIVPNTTRASFEEFQKFMDDILTGEKFDLPKIKIAKSDIAHIAPDDLLPLALVIEPS